MKHLSVFTLASVLSSAVASQAAMIGSYDFENVSSDIVPNLGTGGTNYNLILPTNSPNNGAANALSTGIAGPGSLGGTVLSPGTDGGYAVINGGTSGTQDTAFDGATGLTITGWYRGSSANPVLANGRVVDSTISGNASGFFLRAESTMAARLRVGDGSAGANVDTPAGFFVSDDTWRFFAVTWDGTDGSVNFYNGTDATVASLVHTGNNGLSALGNFGATTSFPNLTLGVQAGNPGSAQFGAFLDNISLYDQALDLASIQGIQAAAVPEPSTFAILAGVAALALAAHRRRRNTLS